MMKPMPNKIPIPAAATGGANLTLTAEGHPPMGFSFATGQVAAMAGDFVITGYSGNTPPYASYGWLMSNATIQDLGVKTMDTVTEIPSTGYDTPASINLWEGHAYAFRLADGSSGILAVKSVTLNLPSITMVFDYKYLPSPKISFIGWVKTAPNWPSTDGMAAVAGAAVNALNESGPPPFTSATPDSSTGAFTVSGIPALSTFYLVVQPPAGYMPVLSKYMNWMDNIQALLPFALLTPDQYASLGNGAGTGMIVGRVASKSSPTTFLAGATIEGRSWTPGNPPTVGDLLPVAYSGAGQVTGNDGIYMIKNVPTGTTVQLVATLSGYTFEFNGAIVPAKTGFISEESFFVTPSGGSCSYAVDPATSSIPAAVLSTPATVNVTAGAGCNWTAVSNNTAWLHVTAPGAGTGNGAFTYTADANTGIARTGTITVNGQTFTVNQAAAPASPTITGLSTLSGPYGSSLIISGQNFGATQGTVLIGGYATGVAITNWTDTSITVTAGRSGPVVVVAGGISSTPSSQNFQVTSPYFTVDILKPSAKVIKGQMAEFILKSSFYNGFTATAITLQLQGGDAATLSGKAVFTPVPISGNGGVVLKIDTTNLSAGTYTAEVQTNNGGAIASAGTFSLQVVTVNDIKFYEWNSLTKNYLTTKTVTTQGQLLLYTEVIGSDGQVFDVEPGVVLSENTATVPILGIYKRFWGYDSYALQNGATQLRATTPDGTFRDLPITVSFPTTSWVSSISLNPAGPIYINRTETLTWSAFGTTSLGMIGYDTSGMMNFQLNFLDKLNRSQDGLSATSTFTLQNSPVDIGTAILYASTNDGAAKAVVPLTTVNAPGTALLAFRIRSLDSLAFAEMFKLHFFGVDNQLKFSRDVFAMHVGNGPVLVGNVPPGVYKLLFVPGNTSVMPQWWPNATDISGAASVAFTADATTDNIIFFAQSQPTGATITLGAASQDFATAAAGTGNVTVTATAGAVWATLANTPWITITSGAIGVGNGALNFTVAANPYSTMRTGTITVGGQTFTVTQAGTGIAPPAYVGTWGAQQLIHFDSDVPWYAESSKTTFNEDGSGSMVIKKNDHNGELIDVTKTFTYTMTPNADGSLALTVTMDGQTLTERLVIGDDGLMGIVDGTARQGQQKLMVLYRIDTARTYGNADLNGEYYNVGFERNMTGVADPPNGNGLFMAISGIHTFKGNGLYDYYGKANSLKQDGGNTIWDDPGKTNQTYAVSANGALTSGSGAFLGWVTGNTLAGGGGGAFQNGVNNQVAYFFLKKHDRDYTTTDLAGKWAIVSFGQDSKTTLPASQGFSASIGTMICDAVGHCGLMLRDRWSGNNATTFATGNLTLTVAPDGSFGGSLGGQSPASAGVIGNNGKTLLLNASLKYPPAEDPYHREILIGIRANGIGDLSGGAAALPGDLNGDGRVNLADAILALQVMAGMNPAGIRAHYTTSGADVNNDYKIGLAEVLFILQKTGSLR